LPAFSSNVKLADVRMRDACILPDPATQTYHIIASTWRGVRGYTSRDLRTWEGPRLIFRIPDNFWPGIDLKGIWAPELHQYRGKYYLFLTFDSATPFPEQWENWLPRVHRGSQVLVGEAPGGPFSPFSAGPTLPAEKMTLDGTLWVEDGVPYMVYCHEWVQIVNGTVECVQLKDDLSATVGPARRLFFGNDAPWSKRSDEFGCWVTDGPSLYKSKSGKLFMLWSSGGAGGYTTGIAISDSGKIAGPWRHQAEPVFAADGGHPSLFTRFDGQLMMILHQPNKATERARLFEIEDTGETLRILRPFPAD
jgi:beta-xylosidase